MYVPVVLKNGEELKVDQDKFRFLLANNKILFFKRTAAWVVVGRDQLRGKKVPFQGNERRNLEAYSKNYWY